MIWLLVLITRAAASNGYKLSVNAAYLVGFDYRDRLTHSPCAYEQ
jgi:hypothetical protein